MKQFLNFLHNEYGISIDAIVSTFITISTFLIAYLFKIIYSAYANYHKRKDIKEIILVAIDELENKIKLQVVSYEKFVSQVGVDNTEPFILEQISFPSIEIVKQIGFRKTYNTYFSGIKIPFSNNKKELSALNRFWETIDFFDSFHKDSWKIGLDFIKNFNINEAKRNNSILSAQRLIDNLMILFANRPTHPVHKSYIEQLDKILFEHGSMPNFNLPTIMDEFYCNKILDLNRRNRDSLKHFVNAIDAAELNRYLLEANIHFKNSKTIVYQTKENFNHLVEKYKESSVKLKNFKSFFYE